MKEKNKIVSRFQKACKQLQKVVDDAATVWPEAELYIGVSTFNLMSGPHHEGNEATARHDRIITSVAMNNTDSGDW
jgi:hypothetical protein